jgi:glycosyltransferase involved in cell wall biosynthesis
MPDLNMNKRTILFLIPYSESTKGGMTEITRMYINEGFFKDPNIHMLNTFFKSGNNRINFLIRFITIKLRFIRDIFKLKPDVVYVMTSAYASFYDKMIYCIIGKIFSKKIMLNVVGAFDDFYEAKSINRILIPWSLSIPDAIIVGGNFWTHYFKKNFPKLKIETIPNPVNSGEYHRLTKKDDNKIKIVFLSELTMPKGLTELVSIIKKIEDKSDKFDFVIMGDGKEYNWLVEQLSKQVEKGFVSIKGRVSHEVKINELAKADLYLFLSHSDFMPISVLEAMSASLPILSTDVGALPDLVHNEVNGYLFSPGDVDPIVDKLLMLQENKHLIEDMGEQSRKIVMKDYDLHAVYGKQLELSNNI